MAARKSGLKPGTKGSMKTGSSNPVEDWLKSVTSGFASAYSRGGLAGDATAAMRNAGSLAAPTLSRAAGYNPRVTNAAIREVNAYGRKVGDEQTKQWLLGMAARGGGQVLRGGKIAKQYKDAQSARAALSAAAKRTAPAAESGGPKRIASGVSKRTGGALKEGKPATYGPKKPTAAQREQAKKATSSWKGQQTKARNAETRRLAEEAAAAKKAAAAKRTAPTKKVTAPVKKATSSKAAAKKPTAKGPGRK